MNCTKPIDAVILADYWLALPGSEEEAIEEHLLDCDDCGRRLREIIALAEGVRSLARKGSLRMIVSDVFLQRAAQAGMRVREYFILPGSSVECTVTAEDEVLIGRLATDLTEAKRVDICICNESGVEQLRLPDIPVHSGATSIAFHESIRFLKAAPSMKMIMRLVTFDDKGSEHTVGEYAFNHTRTLPGPGALVMTSETTRIIDQFNEAFNRHDADALAPLLTDDTVFENTSPAPDGLRIEGRDAVVQFWREWFSRNSDSTFEAEDMFVCGDRAVVCWVYRKLRNGQPWHLRGVDVFTVRDGKVAAKLAYVKG